jgi:hypothetical protein
MESLLVYHAFILQLISDAGYLIALTGPLYVRDLKLKK